MRKQPQPGTQVRLTGEFLRNTGQHTGPEGLGRWTVQACCCGLCTSGRFVAVDEHVHGDDALRHFNIANLEKVRK